MSGTGAPQARPDDPMSATRAGSMDSRIVLDADQIGRACARIAHQILEANRGAKDLVLMGIPICDANRPEPSVTHTYQSKWTAARSFWSMTSSTPDVRCAPRWMRSVILVGRALCS